MDSILDSVKKILGISEDNHDFDADLIMHINTVFLSLNQLGVGPEEGFNISDANSTWDEFIGDNKRLECAKSYVALKVKLLFEDPNSTTVESTNRILNELEFRILCVTDSAK